LKDFVTALEDKLMDVTDKNSPGLVQLPQDCGHQALPMNFSAH
jgi:hypothetical protein